MTDVVYYHYIDSNGNYMGGVDNKSYAEPSWTEVLVDPPHGDARYIDGVWDMSTPVRADRDGRLAEVDAIAGNALRWAALDTATQAEWSTYRQALLDVPQQAGFPNDITWPTKVGGN
jgi:hypothetical protein